MKRLGEFINQAPIFKNQNLGKQICKKCGEEVNFGLKQFRRPCPKCGIVITIPKMNVIKPDNEKEINCFYCMDTGLIIYEAQDGNLISEYGAICVCPLGMTIRQNYPEAGLLQNININAIAKKNEFDYRKRKGLLDAK